MKWLSSEDIGNAMLKGILSSAFAIMASVILSDIWPDEANIRQAWPVFPPVATGPNVPAVVSDTCVMHYAWSQTDFTTALFDIIDSDTEGATNLALVDGGAGVNVVAATVPGTFGPGTPDPRRSMTFNSPGATYTDYFSGADANNQLNPDTNARWSVGGWVYIPTSGTSTGANHAYFQKGRTGNANGAFQLFRETLDRWRLQVNLSNVTVGTFLPTQRWDHFSGTHDPADNPNSRAYLRGVLTNSALTNSQLAGDGGNIYMGARNDASWITDHAIHSWYACTEELPADVICFICRCGFYNLVEDRTVMCDGTLVGAGPACTLPAAPFDSCDY